VHYYAFDLLAYRGKSLLELPLATRRELLEQSAPARLSDPVRLSVTLDASASEVPSI
jgi:ATP-dependent DNA ligase